VTISGVTEPVIGQRSEKGVIQLRDGEPCLLAGLLENSYTYNNSGTPGLSQIPFLKYLFGSINKEVSKDEIVFVLIPHIVRESVLTNLNTRAIDTGTSTSIELRHAANPEENLAPVGAGPEAPAQTTTAANAAAGMVQQLRQQAMPPAPPVPGGVAGATAANLGTAQAPATAAAGPPVAFTLLPVNSTQPVGSTFRASVVATNAHDLFDVPLQVQFDPKVLQLVNVDTGGLLGGDGQPVALVHRDEGNGMVTIRASRPPNVKGVDGQGEVCLLTFKAIAAGDSTIALVKVGAKNSINANLPAVGSQATVHVK
jgi:general secretion pathway protein D